MNNHTKETGYSLRDLLSAIDVLTRRIDGYMRVIAKAGTPETTEDFALYQVRCTHLVSLIDERDRMIDERDQRRAAPRVQQSI